MSTHKTGISPNPRNGRVTSTANEGKAGVLRDIVDGVDYPFVIDDDDKPPVHEGQDVIFEPHEVELGPHNNRVKQTVAKLI